MGSLVDIRESQRRNIPTDTANKNSRGPKKDTACPMGDADAYMQVRGSLLNTSPASSVLRCSSTQLSHCCKQVSGAEQENLR